MTSWQNQIAHKRLKKSQIVNYVTYLSICVVHSRWYSDHLQVVIPSKTWFFVSEIRYDSPCIFTFFRWLSMCLGKHLTLNFFDMTFAVATSEEDLKESFLLISLLNFIGQKSQQFLWHGFRLPQLSFLLFIDFFHFPFFHAIWKVATQPSNNKIR